jgi:hypothetical protein
MQPGSPEVIYVVSNGRLDDLKSRPNNVVGVSGGKVQSAEKKRPSVFFLGRFSS